MFWGDLLEDMRARIKEITLKMVDLFSERLDLARQIGKLKRERGLPIKDQSVEKDLWNSVKERCIEKRLGEWECRRLFNFLISSSIRAQVPEGGGAGPHVEIFRRAKEMEKQGIAVYHLEVGEPPWSFPPEVLDAMIEAIKRGQTRYGTSLGNERFREAASNWISKRDSIDASLDQVMPFPGSKYALFSILSVFLRPGDRLGIWLPAWPAYKGMASHLSLEVVEISSLEELESLKGVSAFILCSPNNPDGKVWSKKELEELSEVLNESNALLISDDAYAELSFEDRIPPSKIYENTISVNTLSKAFGMTGFRVGYVHGKEEYIKRLARFLSLTITSVPEFIQEGAAAALMVGERFVKDVRMELESYLGYALKQLEGGPLEVSKPHGGLYLFPKVLINDFDSSKFASEVLEDKGIAVAPGAGFGPFPDRIRITYASPYADPGIALLREAIESWTSS